MTAKEYLEQLIDIRVRIKALNRKISECRERASNTAAGSSGETTQHSGENTSKIVRNVENKLELEASLEKIKFEFEQFETRATLEINRLPNNQYTGLLMEKYVNGLTWEQVAEAIDKDPDYTRKVLHSRALAEFEKINPEHARKNPVISL